MKYIATKDEAELFLKEAMKQVNPNYSDGFEWQNNCQRCCSTYEAIRRGYDVISKPTDAKNSIELRNEKFVDYATNAFSLMFKDADIIKAKGFDKKEIKQAMKTWGDGARCEICIVWQDWNGHVFMAEQVEGKTIFLDPQSNEVYDESVFDQVKKGYTKYFRTDNLDFTDNIIDCCQNRKGGKK